MPISCNVILGIFAVVGVVLLVIGGSLIPVFKKVIHNKVTQKMVLANNSETFKTWENPTVPVYMQYWVFDVRNAHEVTSKGDRPIVVEKGPYTYREIRSKGNITFHNNGTLTYTEPKSYVFEPSMSHGAENDTFTSINLPLLAVAHIVQSHTVLRMPVKEAIKLAEESLFTTQTVKGYLWGYEEPILKKINDLARLFLNRTIIDDRVGIYTGASGNGTNDGSYTIFTGENGTIGKLNKVDLWRGERLSTSGFEIRR